jgi:hypothetical protein
MGEERLQKDEASPPEVTASARLEVSPASFGSSLLERAKKAKEQAQLSAAGLANKASELTDQAAAKAGELKDASLGRLLETLDDFNAALPVIREAGYTLSNVDIGLGLPPKVSASFVASDDVSAQNVERLIAEHAEKKFTLLLMKSLFQAWQLQTRIKIAGLKPKGITIEIGMIPNITVRFA